MSLMVICFQRGLVGFYRGLAGNFVGVGMGCIKGFNQGYIQMLEDLEPSFASPAPASDS